jgi:hypothetical protein
VSAGHVFVVNGRLEHLDADAFLVPTDPDFDLEDYWAPVWGGGDGAELRPESWDGCRCGRAADGRPLWFLDVSIEAGEESGAAADDRALRWLTDGLREALEAVAAADLETGPGRARPLVALPTIGVGKGGFAQVRGEALRAILDTSYAVAAASGVDIVVVAAERSDFAAFQAVRRTGQARDGLSDDLREHARRLAELARAGQLALFLGAGVSVPAGLPSWGELLAGLLRRTDSHVEPEAFERLDDLDRAELIRRLLPQAGLGTLVAEEFAADRHALGHALLAGLGCREVVTTNFDTLFELAVAGASGGDELTVLPWGQARAAEPWLLKMHGDVEHPDDIVLSRRDVVRYDAAARPVGALLQTLLMSRHLLIVGASMTDENVLRLAHEVRDFLERHGRSQLFGTVLSLRPEPAKARLWEGELDYVCVAPDGADRADAARALEIFLDAVAVHAATDASYLLDPRYEGLLDEDERAVARELRQAGETVRRLAGSSDTWSDVLTGLARLGLPAEEPEQQD